MGTSIYFPISAIMYSILFLCLFFCKKHLKSVETKIYAYLLVTNFIGLILELLCTYAAYIHNSNLILSDIILKSYLAYNCVWTLLLLIYVLYISVSKDLLRRKKKSIIVFASCVLLFSLVLVYALPIELIVKDNFQVRYTTGLSVRFSYMICGLFLILMFILTLSNIKKAIRNKKYIPIFLFWAIGLAGMIIQYFYPSLLILTYIETFMITIMYHTIENPDMRMIEQLNIARDQADKANQAKSDFLSNMSHEIRTPLNAIVGFLTALSEDDLPDSAKEEVDDILMACDSLLEIVNGILDISKIEANKLEIIDTEYSFKKVFDDLVVLTRARLGDKGLEFRISYDETIPPVLYGDASRVKQVILNLLTNSVKYTKEGFIEFKATCVKQGELCRVFVSVEDSGIGIKKEDAKKLFTKFERLGVERNTTVEGTGLGLAITKRLIELMNGNMVIQSTYGKGSKFTVALDQKIVLNKTFLEEPKEQKLETVDVSGKKVLIVDDNKINLKVASRLLQSYNLNITEVESGFVCIEKLQNNEAFDLILMDDMMPKMSGQETFERLKQIPGFNTPVVILTANAISGMREKYLGLGFNDYLAKPIEKPELDRVIREFLGK